MLSSTFGQRKPIKLSPCIPFNNLSQQQLLGVFLNTFPQSDGSKFYYQPSASKNIRANMSISLTDQQLKSMFSSFSIDVNQSTELSPFLQSKILLEYFNGRLTQIKTGVQSACYSFEIIAYFI